MRYLSFEWNTDSLWISNPPSLPPPKKIKMYSQLSKSEGISRLVRSRLLQQLNNKFLASAFHSDWLLKRTASRCSLSRLKCQTSLVVANEWLLCLGLFRNRSIQPTPTDCCCFDRSFDYRAVTFAHQFHSPMDLRCFLCYWSLGLILYRVSLIGWWGLAALLTLTRFQNPSNTFPFLRIDWPSLKDFTIRIWQYIVASFGIARLEKMENNLEMRNAFSSIALPTSTQGHLSWHTYFRKTTLKYLY